MRGPEAYNFLALVALEESDDERFRNQAKIMVKVQLDNLDSKINDEDSNLAPMVWTDPDNGENNQEEAKVSFEHVKKNIHSYSKKKFESLSQVLIDVYLSISKLKKIFWRSMHY